MSVGEIVAIISVVIAFLGMIITACSCAYAIKNSKRTDTNDVIERTREMTTLNVKLDGISSNVQDIKFDISSTKDAVSKLTERVVEVEASTKSAHKRIDGVEERLNP